MIRFLKGFNFYANEIVKKLLIVTFSSMTILIFLQVLFRYVFKSSLSWSEELARYLFIWLTFLGASIATREKSHINVSVLKDSIKNDIIRKIFILFTDLLCMMFLGVLIRWGVPIAIQILQLGQVSPSMPFLYIGIIYFAIPLGSLLMFTNILESLIDQLWNNQVPERGGSH